MSATTFLEKAEETLKAAQMVIEHGFTNSAANRCYYAAFHAARSALIKAGVGSAEKRWSHEGIQGDLSLLTRRKKIYPAHLLADLSSLRDLRDVADYKPQMVSLKAARGAVRTATDFVAIVRKVVEL